MKKLPKLSLADMKALLPPLPVLANESQEQFEKLFDQVVAALDAQDMVELILVWDFVLASWELARYARHRAVTFDRKFKNILADQVSHLADQKARREALAQRLAEYVGQRPSEVGHLIQLEDKVIEADRGVNEILKRTPGELAYNRGLEKNIALHKDQEFLIASCTKRCGQALAMLDRYRQDLGTRVEQATKEILDAEYNSVENQPAQIAPPLVPAAEPEAEKQDPPDQSSTDGSNREAPPVSEGSAEGGANE
jgi:hypothetical protein